MPSGVSQELAAVGEWLCSAQLLGGACLRVGELPLSGPPVQRHRIALLALVVAAWPQPLSRDRAMALLWPERDTANARRLLNLAVHVLRSALGEGAVVSTGDGLLLQPAHLSCDVHDLREAIAARDPDRIVQAYTGHLLDGFHLDGSLEFGYWLDERRAELTHAYVGALLAVAEAQERSGDAHSRVGTCRRLVTVDPHSPVYAQALMHALDAAGDRAAAMRHASDYAQRMQRDLELGPATEVMALAERYRTEPMPSARVLGSTAPSASVVLLGFRARSAGSETEIVERQHTSDLLAWQLYLQGRRNQAKFNLESLAHASNDLKRAIARDPAFALAHASLAMLYIEQAEIGALAAARALELQPDLAEAHCASGYLKTIYEFDWSGAESAFRRAIELSPGSADAYDLFGRLCAGIGRHDEAIALLLRAQELDPLAHRVDLATALLRAGRLDEGLQRAEAASELEPFDRARATLAWAYILSGRMADGLVELERSVAASPGNTMWLAQLGEAYAMAGDVTKAREVLRTLEARTKLGYVCPYHFAYVYTGLGDAERALDWLERAIAERAGAAYGIKGSFLLAPLRTHPRFSVLMKGLGLDNEGLS